MSFWLMLFSFWILVGGMVTIVAIGFGIERAAGMGPVFPVRDRLWYGTNLVPLPRRSPTLSSGR